MLPNVNERQRNATNVKEVNVCATYGIKWHSGEFKNLYLCKKSIMQPIFINVYGIERNYYVNIAHIALLEEIPGENDRMYLNVSDSNGLPIIIELEHNMESVMEDIEEQKNALNLLNESQSQED